jgi:hypothetical protein
VTEVAQQIRGAVARLGHREVGRQVFFVDRGWLLAKGTRSGLTSEMKFVRSRRGVFVLVATALVLAVVVACGWSASNPNTYSPNGATRSSAKSQAPNAISKNGKNEMHLSLAQVDTLLRRQSGSTREAFDADVLLDGLVEAGYEFQVIDSVSLGDLGNVRFRVLGYDAVIDATFERLDAKWSLASLE